MTYQPKRKPREHQERAEQFLEGRTFAALLMGMRTGKTKVVVDDWGKLVLDKKVDDLLVIAPAGAYLPWADAAKLDLPDDVLCETRIFIWTSARASTKRFQGELTEFMDHTGPRILLVNSEAISSVKDARALCLDYLDQGGSKMLVIDESVIIKNRDSECSKFCVDKLSQRAYYKRILTGLVSPQSPLDVYQQYRFLDRNILPEPWGEFRDRYCQIHRICMLHQNVIKAKFITVFGLRNRDLPLSILKRHAKTMWPNDETENWPDWMIKSKVYAAPEDMKRSELVDAIFRAGRYIQSVPVIKGYRNTEELHNRIAPYSFRVRLEDCYDMPLSDYSFRDVEMTPQQAKAYSDMREFATAQLAEQSFVTASNVISQMLRLHQILCGHTTDEEGVFHEIPENRTASLLQFLEDYDGKAIVWCSYDHDIQKVSKALKKKFGNESVARFWGGNKKTREEEEAKFKTDPECRFQVATPDAGGKGRTWDMANLVVYYSCKDNLDHRAQSEERAKNVGKKIPIAYVDFRVPGTVEDKILDALRRKVRLSEVISGDDYRQWL